LFVIPQRMRRDTEYFGHAADRECFRHDAPNVKASSALEVKRVRAD
jgi:hypothetical protein